MLRLSILFIAVALSLTACQETPAGKAEAPSPDSSSSAQPEEVFADSAYQLTGVAITPQGRLFVNYPYWLDKHLYSVVEVANGVAKPYPDATWNNFKKGDNGLNKFVCVQSVVADEKGYLWVVDAAGIGLGPVYQKSNKVVKINLANDSIERIYRFPDSVAGTAVYLNDIRIDNHSGFAYLTSSSNGGIVVLNIQTGAARNVLGSSPSVLSDSNYHFSPDGAELRKPDGSALKVNSDGIALTPDGAWLYYKPLTDDRLYRVPTSLLRDFQTSQAALTASVEDLGHFTTSDGMIFDNAGNLYLGDLERGHIIRITPDKKAAVVLRDDRLRWPDSYSISSDGYLYISCSQIQDMPWFHGGQDVFKGPFRVFRLKL